MVQAGLSHTAIGREQAISRERVRQIVVKASCAATPRHATPTRQSAKPPLTRRKPLIRNSYVLDKACRGLTLLDKT
jgi:hypothetical protein